VSADRPASVERIRRRLAESDTGLILVTMVALYVLFILFGIVLFPASDLVGSLASSLQGVTQWAALYAIMALALNLQWGYAGLLNIGVAGFMAVGVYTMAILYNPINASPPGIGIPFFLSDVFGTLLGLSGLGFAVGLLVSVLLGMVAAALVGAVAALPAFRVRGDYLAIITVAFSEIIRQLLLAREFQTFTLFGNLDFIPDVALGTGAAQGIDLPTNPARVLYYADADNPGEGTTALGSVVFEFTGGLGIADSVVVAWTYTLLFLVVALVVFYWIVTRIGNSPFGRVLKAIREDEQVAEALGKDTRVFKLKVFVIGCALMGLGGILWEGSKGFTNPTTTTFLPLQTFFIFIALSIGGTGSNTGSVLGGALFAGLLFQGPLTVMQILGSVFNVGSTQVPPNFADALGALVALDLPRFLAFAFEKRFALRFVLIGTILVVLIHRRPTGLLGHRTEEAASIDLMKDASGAGDEAARADGGRTDE